MTIDQLQATLMRYCFSITRSKWDAEDLVQDTWTKALNSQQLSQHPNIEAWMLRIAKNGWIDLTRRRMRAQRYANAQELVQPQAEQYPVYYEELFHLLLKHLTPLQRAVFLLRDVFDYSGIETAQWLHTTEGAVKAALIRARQSLIKVREALEQHAVQAPADEGLKMMLHQLSNAYHLGDIAALIHLVQSDTIDAVQALAQVQHIQLQQEQPRHASLMQAHAWHKHSRFNSYAA